MNDTPGRTIESIFKQESGRIIAGLIRISGSFDRAEEAMQEAFATALTSWKERGTPDNPAAWITTTAKRKLIDQSRHQRTHDEKASQILYEMRSITDPEDSEWKADDGMIFPDDRLRLIFTCC